jgi:hypothetical protein
MLEIMKFVYVPANGGTLPVGDQLSIRAAFLGSRFIVKFRCGPERPVFNLCSDLLQIRKNLWASTLGHGKIVVHGDSVTVGPGIRSRPARRL